MDRTLDFDRLVYVGDSLTDSGAFFAATSAVAFFGLPPTAAGYAGQYSDGAVYSDFVADLIGVQGGDDLNYAVGGAQVLSDRTVAEVLAGTGLIRPDAALEDLNFRVDYLAQVDRFLGDTVGADLSGTAVSVLIGVNDFDNFVPTSAATAVAEAIGYGAQIATNAVQQTAAFAAAGVGTIILNTLPDISVFPTFDDLDPVSQALAPLAVGAYNATLRLGETQLEQLGADVLVVEFGAMFEEIAVDFTSFGFRTFDAPVLLGSNGAGGLNPEAFGIPRDQIGFFDPVHPTTELHEILGVFQAESLTSTVTVGTAQGERLRGTKDDDLILARDGNDTILLGKGDDVAIAGLGNDRVFGGKGSDLLAGGDGDDLLSGGNGRDILADGAGDDRVFAGSGNDVLIDGAGSDLAFGGGGSDLFIFTESALSGRTDNDRNTFFGGGGNDTLVLRLQDPLADLGESSVFGFTHYQGLGLTTFGIERVVIVDGTETPVIARFDDALATAELWNFV